jgi:hypothetical protein
MAFVRLFLVWFLAGGVLLLLVTGWTRGLRQPWLRQLLRSAVAALAFTPSLASLDNTVGTWPLPAGWILFCALVVDHAEDRLSDLLWGGIPILAVTLVLWAGMRAASNGKAPANNSQ